MTNNLGMVNIIALRSRDHFCSGFLHCLSREGEVFDTVKYGWMVCRQVWMYAKLYNSLARYHTAEVLEAAKSGTALCAANLLATTNYLISRSRIYSAACESF